MLQKHPAYSLLEGQRRGEYSIVIMSKFGDELVVFTSLDKKELKEVEALDFSAPKRVIYTPTQEELAARIAHVELARDFLTSPDLDVVIFGAAISDERRADIRERYEELYNRHLEAIQEYDRYADEFVFQADRVIDEYLFESVDIF